jgi:hypothetical protein
MVELETRNGKMVKTLDTLYDEHIEQYLEGNFTEGLCSWNGDDALMGAESFGKKFGLYCKSLGYEEFEYAGYKKELMEWCEDHLLHLESKFR